VDIAIFRILFISRPSIVATHAFERGGRTQLDAAYANLAEAALNNLQAVGIRAKLRPLERAAFFKGYAEKSYKNIIQGASGAFGNAATRLEAFVVKGGAYVYGSYPVLAPWPPTSGGLGEEVRRSRGGSHATPFTRAGFRRSYDKLSGACCMGRRIPESRDHPYLALAARRDL
jgi:hypothetical protein